MLRDIFNQDRQNSSLTSQPEERRQLLRSSIADVTIQSHSASHDHTSYGSIPSFIQRASPSKLNRALMQGLIACGCAATTVFSNVAIARADSTTAYTESSRELIDEVWELVNTEFYGDSFNFLDWNNIRATYLNRTYTDMEEAYVAVQEMLETLNDPLTRFMDPEAFKAMQIDPDSSVSGVGLQISVGKESSDIVVVAPVESSPAYNAGILPGDIIRSVGGQRVEGLKLFDVVQLTRGPIGSDTTIVIERDGEPLSFDMTRTRVEIHPVRYSIKNSSEGSIGYIRLTQFSATAAGEMKNAILALEQRNVSGYLLDLRTNPGGLLFTAIDVTDFWLDRGTIVSIVDRNGVIDEELASGQALTDKPLVILVDSGSASASEILASALRDNDRAVLVGTQTHGVGLIQSVRGLQDGSGVAVTIGKYLTPLGRDIHNNGISPDHVVELTDEQQNLLLRDRDRVGTLEDPQYAKAIEILSDFIQTTR